MTDVLQMYSTSSCLERTANRKIHNNDAGLLTDSLPKPVTVKCFLKLTDTTLAKILCLINTDQDQYFACYTRDISLKTTGISGLNYL